MKRTIKKTAKNLLRIVCFLVLAFLFAVSGINLYIILTVKDQISAPAAVSVQNADCIMVLGAGVRADGTPSPMLRDRLDAAVELYNAGVCDRILMSGDHGTKYYNEVKTMKDYVVAKGVDPDQVFLDHAGFSTYESVYRAKEIFGAKKIIIVTQKYHLYRALYDARCLGLEAYGAYSEGDQYAGQAYRNLREAGARVKDFFITIYKPLPTYLGDAVPMQSSSGSITESALPVGSVVARSGYIQEVIC